MRPESTTLNLHHHHQSTVTHIHHLPQHQMGQSTSSNINSTQILRFLCFPTESESNHQLYGHNGKYHTLFGGPPPEWHGSSPAQSDALSRFLQRAGMQQRGQHGASSTRGAVIHYRPPIRNAHIVPSLFHLNKSSLSFSKSHLGFHFVTAVKNVQLELSVQYPSSNSIAAANPRHPFYQETIQQEADYFKSIDLTSIIEELPSSSQLPAEESPPLQRTSLQDDSQTSAVQPSTVNVPEQQSLHQNAPPAKYLFTVTIQLKEKTSSKKSNKCSREVTTVHISRSSSDDRLHIESSNQILHANGGMMQNKRSKRDTRLKTFYLADLYQQHGSTSDAFYYTSQIPLENRNSNVTHVHLPADSEHTPGGASDADDSSEDIRNPCVICMCEQSSCSCLPCRHLCMCLQCSEALSNQESAPRGEIICPLCRTKISTIVNLNPVSEQHAE